MTNTESIESDLKKVVKRAREFTLSMLSAGHVLPFGVTLDAKREPQLLTHIPKPQQDAAEQLKVLMMMLKERIEKDKALVAGIAFRTMIDGGKKDVLVISLQHRDGKAQRLTIPVQRAGKGFQLGKETVGPENQTYFQS